MTAKEIEYNYAEDLAIDPDMLDEEWLKQPGLYMKYVEAHADAIKKRDKVWERLKIRRSQLVKESKEKGASNAVMQEAYYRDHQDHKDLKDELIEAEYEMNILAGVVNDFGYQRKAALENEVALWLGQYFAGPTEPRILKGGKRIIDMKAIAISNSSRNQRAKLNEEPPAKERSRRSRG